MWRDAGCGPVGAIANHVTDAPPAARPGLSRGLQDGVEGLAVAVDVAEDRDAGRGVLRAPVAVRLPLCRAERARTPPPGGERGWRGARVPAAWPCPRPCRGVGLRVFAWGVDDAPTRAVRLADWFDPAAVAANDGYRRGLWLLSVVALVVTPVVAVVVAALGGRWRPVVVRAAGARPWGAGALMGAGAPWCSPSCRCRRPLLACLGARARRGAPDGVVVGRDRGVMTLIDMAVFALVAPSPRSRWCAWCARGGSRWPAWWPRSRS